VHYFKKKKKKKSLLCMLILSLEYFGLKKFF